MKSFEEYFGVLDNVWNIPSGAWGGNRTRMALRPRDFKSLASTNFATQALKKPQANKRHATHQSSLQ
jgi:hypothetical protein